MFSITAEGVIFFNGEKIGKIDPLREHTTSRGERFLDFVVRGVSLETMPDEGFMGDTVLLSSIASGGTVREYTNEEPTLEED